MRGYLKCVLHQGTPVTGGQQQMEKTQEIPRNLVCGSNKSIHIFMKGNIVGTAVKLLSKIPVTEFQNKTPKLKEDPNFVLHQNCTSYRGTATNGTNTRNPKKFDM